MLKSLLFITLLTSPALSEVFTALTSLTTALQHEKDLAEGLRDYVELEYQRLQKVLE